MSDKIEVKLNLINQKLEKILSMMIQIHDPDHDPNLDQSSDQSDHDHDHDQSDQDLIMWFQKELIDIGIDPEHRDLNSVIRSIRYFRKKRLTVKNVEKYVMSFLPPAKKPTIDAQINSADDNIILAIPWYSYPTWEDMVIMTSKLSNMADLKKLNLPDELLKLRQNEGNLINVMRKQVPDWIDSVFQDAKVKAQKEEQ